MVKDNIRKIIALVAVLLVGIVAAIIGINANIDIKSTEEGYEASIQFSEEQVPATMTIGEEAIEGIETGQGAIGEEVDIETVDGYSVPTVESVESNGPVTEIDYNAIYQKCLEENEECGQGAVYPTLNISSPQAFTNATLDQCIDVDGYFGSQCWDLVAAMHYQYTGKVLTTCGTGAAKGVIADGCWQQNYTPDKYRMIWDPNQIVAGAHVYFGSGAYGHEGIALGTVNNGYIALLGQNQGGRYCQGGGAATNIINISIKDFIGAAMPLIWDIPEPNSEPTPEPENNVCQVREVQAGDTLGAIMQECRGEIEWGAAMNEYAGHWYSTKFQIFLTVYDGWASQNGVGLFAGDVIEYRN